MNDSIFDILGNSPNDMIGGAVTPAGAHFFKSMKRALFPLVTGGIGVPPNCGHTVVSL